MDIFSKLYVSFQRKAGNKSHNLANFSLHQAVIAYNLVKYEDTIMRLHDRLLIAPWHGLCSLNEEQCWHLLFNTDQGTLKYPFENNFGDLVKARSLRKMP